jgi:hypothetical protein
MHHRRAARLFGAVVVLDVALGAAFGATDHVGVWNGIYFGVVTVTTVGYGDILPHGWAAHVLAVAVMLLIIPLWSTVFSFITAGLTADHIDKRHAELKEKLPS